jgi:hypothetical protein
MKLVLFFFGVSLMVGTFANANVNLTSVRAQLDAANSAISINESGLKGIDTAIQVIVENTRKECGVDLTSLKPGTLKCTMENYSTLAQQFAQLKASQSKVEEQLAAAKKSYKTILKDSKGQLTPADFSSLLETSIDLGDADTRRLKVSAKADLLKLELNQAKATIEQSEQYKLLNKAITNTLNSKLFCQARDRCDEKAGAIYEGDVAAKIMANAASSVARKKVNAKSAAPK